MRKQAGGYIFGIKDPETGHFVFIGNGTKPWESVQRHLQRSSNHQLRAWAKQFGDKIEILGEVIVRQYNGEPVNIPPVREGFTRIEWEILGVESDYRDETAEAQITIVPKTIKQRKIEELKSAGYKLLNAEPGRPKGCFKSGPAI